MANPRSSHQPTSKVIPSAHARRREQFLTSRPSADEILQIVRSVTNTTTTTHPPPPPPQTPAGALLDETRYKKSLTAFAVLVRAHHTTPLPHRSTAPPPHRPTVQLSNHFSLARRGRHDVPLKVASITTMSVVWTSTFWIILAAKSIEGRTQRGQEPLG